MSILKLPPTTPDIIASTYKVGAGLISISSAYLASILKLTGGNRMPKRDHKEKLPRPIVKGKGIIT